MRRSLLHERCPVFPRDLIESATTLLDGLRRRRLSLVTAESCTGGLLAGLLTEIPGASDVLERGLVSYSNTAKTDLLGVDPAVIERHGAVSAEVAEAMVRGAIACSPAQVAIAVTGIAGPGGGTTAKPVGLVHIAALRSGGRLATAECRFGDIGRSHVRIATLRAAIALVTEVLD
jgi:nicotinamide-nucleotide amidase